MQFEEALKALQRQMSRQISVPRKSAEWRVEWEPHPVVVATMPAADLSLNIQSDAAAVPSFALCLAWWFEHWKILGTGKVEARVELTNPFPDGAHFQRSAFLLHELARLLPERFTFTPRHEPAWPTRPIVNSAASAREASDSLNELNSEYALACAFTTQPQIVEEFAAIDDVEPFKRQLPVGIFDGEITAAARWTPGGNSQVDLWSKSTDGRTGHLFELKKAGNAKLGILPEALWYALLLHRIRMGDFGGKAVGGGGSEMDAVRSAQRITMWLLVEGNVHPLVEHEGDSPLEWIRTALTGSGLDFGVLPFERDGGKLRLLPDRRWPPPSAL